MTNFARIIDNVAVDVSTDPENSFHPDIASQFVVVPDSVIQGSIRDQSGVWTAPVVVEPQPVTESAKVSPVQFKLLFTPMERVALKDARATDALIDDFFDIVDDPRLTYVDLGLQSTKDAISYLVSKNLLTQERGAEVLSGVLK